MQMSLEMRPMLRLEMEITGGMTQTVFTKTELKLNSYSDYQEALQFVARKKNMGKYHSMMDFLFCESFPVPWRFKCFTYYNDRGPRLVNDPDFTEKIRMSYDLVLCNVILETCLVALKEKWMIYWGEMIEASNLFMEAC